MRPLPMTQATTLDAALAAARNGYKVFPTPR